MGRTRADGGAVPARSAAVAVLRSAPGCRLRGGDDSLAVAAVRLQRRGIWPGWRAARAEEPAHTADGAARMSGPLPVAVIGAGPAGLTAALTLARAGRPAIVVEAGERVGGIARTEAYKGYRFDIGGHRFFTKVPEVQALWEEWLGSEFQLVSRLSRIFYDGRFYDYPLRLPNVVSNLGALESARIALSYAKARVAPIHPEESFQDWVTNRFGDRLYRAFFKTYTEKVWGIPCTEIRADWAAQRIRGLSLARAVRHAI